jgi:hypothetical protein
MELGPPPTTDFVVDVTEDDVAFFDEHGHLTVERITTDEEIDWFRAAYDEFEAMPRSGFPDTVFDVGRPYGSTAEPDLGQLLFPERRMKGVDGTAMYRNSRRIASRLLRVPADRLESWGHLIFKPPIRGSETPWHQDEAYWDTHLGYHAVGAWVALDDTDLDNGCLWFAEGSHKGEVLHHRHLGDDPRVHILEVTEPFDRSRAVPVPLSAGGVSFHHPRTLHHARPNTTERKRRAWATEYQTTPVSLEVPADRPWVGEGHQAMVEAFTANHS